MRATLLIALCLVLVLSAAAAAEDYAIHIDRHPPVGHRDFVTGALQSQRLMVMVAKGREFREEKSEIVRYAVTTEILETGPQGNALRVAVTVHKLTRESEGKTANVLSGGEHVIASLEDGKSVFDLDGKRLPKEVSEVLDHLVNVRAKPGTSDDEMFGSKVRRSVGESWPINAEATAKDSSTGFSFAPEDVTGSTRLVGLRRMGKTDCLELQMQMSLRQAEMHTADMPEGMNLKLTSMTGTDTRIVPADGTLGVVAESSRIDITMTMNGTVNGVQMTGQGQMRETSYHETFPVR